MSEIEVFQSAEFELRITPVGDSFAVQAPGLARALGFRDAADLVRFIPDEEKGYELVRTPGGEQRVWHLTEPGFYRAIGQRQSARVRDDATRELVERFQGWVYREVLPAIRRTGRYEAAPVQRFEVPGTYAEALRLAADQAEEIERQRAELELAAPKARSWDVLATGTGDYSVADAAKVLSRDPAIRLGQGRLFTLLSEYGWTYRQRGDTRWRPYQTAIDTGRLSELPASHYHPRTAELIIDAPQVRVTTKGLHELHRRLGGTQPLHVQPELEEATR